MWKPRPTAPQPIRRNLLLKADNTLKRGRDFLFATLKSFQRDSASKSAIATIESLTVTTSSMSPPPRHPVARRHSRRITAHRRATRTGKDSVRLKKQLIQKCTV